VNSFIDDTGCERLLGNLDAPLTGLWPVYGDDPNKTPMVPRSEWQPCSMEAFLPPVHNQENVGMCNASATCAALEACRALQGLEYKQLSAGHLYGKINGGVDRGSLLEEGLRESMSRGVCTVDTVPYLNWRLRPSNATAEALSYRVLEAWLCPTFDHVASALQRGFLVIEGIMWYSNFRPDGDGWLPARGSGRPGGHALCGYGLAERGGAWGARTRNSWSAQWGANGNCVIPETLFGSQIGGMWAVRVVVDEGGQVPVAK